ncbi:MAG TPA: hypothetical protein VG488_13670 [Candidatus Angelobacter sp.]|nr:hypothetical protein [Candidatus Angelobacter sp.]
MQSTIVRSLGLVLLAGLGASAQNLATDSQAKTPAQQAQPALQQPKSLPDLEKRHPISDTTRFQLIQILNAEFVRVRKMLPIGDKSITLSPEGEIKPTDGRLHQLAMAYGAACKVGDRVKITSVAFREKGVYLEVNGGPKKKSKWYDHISVGGMGGMTGGQDPNQAQATGAAITLEFKHHVPEMTGEELKQLLNPVFDFSVRSAAEVYLETLPPKVKDAITKHEVLVGMNREMVIMAKERPGQKLREKDDKGDEYEEWIYGAPPKDVVFVRFKGDEVSQVKTMKIAGEMVVKTEKEVDVKEGVASLASANPPNSNANGNANPGAGTNTGTGDAAAPAQSGQQQAGQQPTHRPTLKRAGEEPDPAVAPAVSTSTIPATSQRKAEPEWGTGGQPGQQPPQNEQPPK